MSEESIGEMLEKTRHLVITDPEGNVYDFEIWWSEPTENGFSVEGQATIRARNAHGEEKV